MRVDKHPGVGRGGLLNSRFDRAPSPDARGGDCAGYTCPVATPDAQPTPQPTAVTIGNFDAVHIGHRALIERCRARVGAGGRVVVQAFNPHPMSVLNPQRAPIPIEPFAIRAQRLRRAGGDEVVELVPTPELLGMSPRAFIDHVIDQYQPVVIVEGHDFHFGSRRAGTPTVLRELASLRGVDVEILAPVRAALTDQSIVTASSTIVRWLLGHGRVRDAGFVLGRPHELAGTVVQGDRLGRTIGFPTANVASDSLLPGDGVYASVVVLPDGHIRGGAVNVGSRPTVNGTYRRAEVHLINEDGSAWDGNGLPGEYDWPITVRLIGWVRDQVKFASIDALREQLGRDVKKVAGMVGPYLRDEVGQASRASSV